MANNAFDNYTRQDKSSRTSALKSKDTFKVFSYIQTAITTLNDDNSNFYEHYFNDISSISDRYFVYNSYTNYQKDAKRALENFFEFKDSLDASSMFLKRLEKNLNYGNLVVDFLNTGTSSFLGKITEIANLDTRRIVEDQIATKQNFLLISTQTNSILDDEENSSDFTQLSADLAFLKSISDNNLLIKTDVINEYFNTDCIIGQSLLNIAFSNKLFFPNVYNTNESTQANLKNNAYPYLNIGNNLTNNLPFMSYVTLNNFDKKGFKQQNPSPLSDIFSEDDKVYIHDKELTKLGLHQSKKALQAHNFDSEYNLEERTQMLEVIGNTYKSLVEAFNEDPAALKVVFLNECSVTSRSYTDIRSYSTYGQREQIPADAFKEANEDIFINVTLKDNDSIEQVEDILLTNLPRIQDGNLDTYSALNEINYNINELKSVVEEYINEISIFSDKFVYATIRSPSVVIRRYYNNIPNQVSGAYYKDVNSSYIQEITDIVDLIKNKTSTMFGRITREGALNNYSARQVLLFLEDIKNNIKRATNRIINEFQLEKIKYINSRNELFNGTHVVGVDWLLNREEQNIQTSDLYLDNDKRNIYKLINLGSSFNFDELTIYTLSNSFSNSLASGNEAINDMSELFFKDDYPKILKYIYECCKSIHQGTESFDYTVEDFQRKSWDINDSNDIEMTSLVAGQFSDIMRTDSILYVDEYITQLIGYNRDGADRSNPWYDGVALKRIFDLHCYTYDGKTNQQINRIRNSFIEPGSNTLDERTLKLDVIKLDNDIKKEKARQSNLNIDSILSVSNKLFNRAKDNFISTSNNYSYLYGNDSSNKVLLTSIDEEIEEFIQDDIFVNNFMGDIVINDKKILKSSHRFIENVKIKNQDSYEKRYKDLTKYTSLIYANSVFKNTKTLIFTLLKDILGYTNAFSDTAISRHSATIFQYENFISAIYEKDFNFNESREYTKRLVAKVINDMLSTDSFITEAKVINHVTTNNVVSHDVESIVEIDKKNKNSEAIFKSLYTTKNLNKIKKYTLIVYPNINEDNFSSDIDIFNYNNSNCSHLLRKRPDIAEDVSENELKVWQRYYRDKLKEDSFYSGTDRRDYKLDIPVNNANVKVIKQIKNAEIENEESNEMNYMFSSQCVVKPWMTKSITSETDIANEENPRYDSEGNLSYNWSSKKNLDIPITDYFYDAANQHSSMLHLVSKKIRLLINFLDLESDLESIETYDDILDYLEGNSSLLKLSHQVLSLSSKLFRVVFNRFATISLHNIISDFDNIEVNKIVGENIKLASKDIEYMYNYMMSNDIQKFSSISSIKSVYSNNLNAHVKFKSKDTDVLFDLIASCNLHDICKSLTLDILRGYNQFLSTINDQISDDNVIKSNSSDLLNKYFKKVSDKDVNAFINNEFYQNIISKKLIKILFNKEKLQEQLREVVVAQSDRVSKDAFKNTRESTVELLEFSRNIINNYITEKEINDKTYDIVKIGIKFDVITNFIPSDIFKFKVRTIFHDSQTADDISCFYYTPVFTSYMTPGSNSSIGFFNVDRNITERFYSVSKESVKSYLKSTGKFNNSHEIISENMLYENMLSSQFCEAYENIINNADPLYSYKNTSVSESIIENTYFEDVSNIEKEEFIKIFKLDKDMLDEYSKQEHFTKIVSNSIQVKEKTKSHSFVKYLSENITDIDIYKTLALNQYYDFFNILIPSPKGVNVSYHISVDLA